MNLAIRLLGCEVLYVSTDPDSNDDPQDDTARDLSGGTLAADRVDVGPTDTWMGFTNGMEAT